MWKESIVAGGSEVNCEKALKDLQVDQVCVCVYVCGDGWGRLAKAEGETMY